MLSGVGLSQAPLHCHCLVPIAPVTNDPPWPRPWSQLPACAVAPVEVPRPPLTIRFVTEATGFKHPCVSYVGQAELRAKTAVLPTATWQVRETCRHGGGGRGGSPGWHQALFAHPRKEVINIDTGLLRHSLGKPAPSLDFSPGPGSPSPACPLGTCCQACPASSQDSLPANFGTALPTCSLGAGQKLRLRESRHLPQIP